MPASDTDTSNICAVLLAAGSSRRFGGDNKLMAEIDGTPLVRRVAEQLLASHVANVIVVTGFEADKLHGALAGLDLQFADNPDFAEGLASSLRRGIAGVPSGARGAMIMLADMPGITAALVDRLIDAFQQEACEKIVFPVRGDRRQGNPVIWPRRFFAELRSLTGDAGAKRLIGKHEMDTLGVPVDDAEVLSDIDEPGDLESWQEDNAS